MTAEPVTDLVAAVRGGDQAAWNRLVDRFAPLVASVCRKFSLDSHDRQDVAAGVWLRLLERLHTLREPAALPGWIATTTRNECLALLRSRRRTLPTDFDRDLPDDLPEAGTELIAELRRQALRDAWAGLSERCRELLGMLFGDPPVPYADVAARLGVRIGTIGPTRIRCLAALREQPALASWGGA
ncbi:MAG: sigma-70 family RNA polymerase sigma factor [Micropruina sp.]|uniref:RNA polymerase sigma factor n=1 Tax=Micropruina sp. TaxID=2737536 RepID=UPI0039E28012